MNDLKKSNTVAQTTNSKPSLGGIQRRKSNLDFSQLSWGTLRKYQYFFRVKAEEKDGHELHTKDAVESAVVKHFEDMKIDYDKLIYKFLKIKKDEKNDQLYNLRKSQRTRYSNHCTVETGNGY